MYYVYLIVNKINNKKYVGYSSNFKRRWTVEKSAAFSPKDNSYNTALSRAFRKYGIENFSFQIIEEFDDKFEALNRESFYISFFRTNCSKFEDAAGYNETDGGEGHFGYVPTLEHKMKISEALKGRPLTEETKNKISLAHLGKKADEVTITKLSESHLGKSVGESNPRAKLTWKIVDEIRNKYSTNNYSTYDLAKECQVSAVQISNIIKYKQWVRR